MTKKPTLILSLLFLFAFSFAFAFTLASSAEADGSGGGCCLHSYCTGTGQWTLGHDESGVCVNNGRDSCDFVYTCYEID